MKRIILSLLSAIVIHTVSYGQDKLDFIDKTLIYEAFFINAQNDTITKEMIEMTYKDSPWSYQPKSQKEIFISYSTDQEGIKSFVYPHEKERKKHVKRQQKKEKGKKGWEEWSWLDEDEITGYMLIGNTYRIHPPRCNQYRYMELTGLPEIHLDQLKIGGSWDAKLLISIGWHDWKGTLTSKSEVVSSSDYSKGKVNLPHAWHIDVEHNHSEKGRSTSKIIFDENSYGFLSFDNKYHDGSRIIMNLIEVKG